MMPNERQILGTANVPVFRFIQPFGAFLARVAARAFEAGLRCKSARRSGLRIGFGRVRPHPGPQPELFDRCAVAPPVRFELSKDTV